MIHLHEHRYEYFEEINEGILKQIPAQRPENGARVLDVGCDSGVLSGAIKERGFEVWGIESNPDACQVARSRIDRVIQHDLTSLDEMKGEIGSTAFDYLVFSDVLEHVYDPFLVLTQYLEYLKPGGKVLISVPNVAVWTNRIGLLFGRFNYTDTGLLDRTHIRFFTFRTAKQLVRATGCAIWKIDYTPFFARALLPLVKKLFFKNRNRTVGNRAITDSFVYKFYFRYVYPLEYWVGFLFKRLFAFRIIVVGRKIESPASLG